MSLVQKIVIHTFYWGKDSDKFYKYFFYQASFTVWFSNSTSLDIYDEKLMLLYRSVSWRGE